MNIKPKDIERVEADTAKQVELCLCWRYQGQALPSGTRVDLRCAECNHRVDGNALHPSKKVDA